MNSQVCGCGSRVLAAPAQVEGEQRELLRQAEKQLAARAR
jgi:hypothetical protein